MGIMYAIKWSPDNLRLASTGDDGTARVWDAKTGKQIDSYTGHSGWVQALAWSPDGKRIASGGLDMTVAVWSAG
jgi:WD40 repeat protein